MTTYKIVRTFQRDTHPTQVIKRGLSLAEARAHCKLKETSSKTATSPEAVERTERCGPWFDGFEEE